MRRGGSLVTAVALSTVLASCSVFSGSSSDSSSGSGSTAQETIASATGQAGSSGKDGKDPVTVTVTGTGDILIHRPVSDDALALAKANHTGTKFDYDPMFVHVKPLLSAADVSICHQETPISSGDELSARGSLVYTVPKEIAPALAKAGFDGCETASNHTWDQGLKGITSTRAQLKAAGLQVAGPTDSASDPGMPAIYEAKGVKIADLSYTYTILNQSGPNTNLPPGAPWLKRWLWPVRGVQGILDDAKKAKAAGADLVIVNIHWGTEYQKMPTQDQTMMAKALLASPDVDGIFGAHAHVIQPCQTIDGKTVFYGLGNFLSNQGSGQAAILGPANADGVIAKYTFSRAANGTWTQKASYQPTMVNLADDHTVELSTPTTNADSFNRTKTILNKLGDCSATPSVGD